MALPHELVERPELPLLVGARCGLGGGARQRVDAVEREVAVHDPHLVRIAGGDLLHGRLGALAEGALVVAELDDRDRRVGRSPPGAVGGDVDARRLEGHLHEGRLAQGLEHCGSARSAALLLEARADLVGHVLEGDVLEPVLHLLVEREDLGVFDGPGLLGFGSQHRVHFDPALRGFGSQQALVDHRRERAAAELVRSCGVAPLGRFLEEVLPDALVEVGERDPRIAQLGDGLGGVCSRGRRTVRRGAGEACEERERESGSGGAAAAREGHGRVSEWPGVANGRVRQGRGIVSIRVRGRPD